MIVNNLLWTNDPFSVMKTKTENKTRYTTYFNVLFNTLLSMFEWKNLPDTIPQRFLESILHTTGEVFIADIDGRLTASCGTLSGEVDAYGVGTECIAVTPIGEARGRRNVDIAYGINNETATTDMLVYWIAHLLGESDKSLRTNIIYSRYMNVPKINDEKDKQAFMEIFKKLEEGEPQAFASRNIFHDLDNGSADVFQFASEGSVDKLQYLSRFYDDILKKFYNFYGQPLQNINKSAQTISDEIHGMDSVSFILPSQMLECRKRLAKHINDIFGTDITVSFSPIWLLEYDSLIQRDTNGNGTPDISEGLTSNSPNQSEPNENPPRTNQEPTENHTGKGEELSENGVKPVETGLSDEDIKLLIELATKMRDNESSDNQYALDEAMKQLTNDLTPINDNDIMDMSEDVADVDTDEK